MINEPVAEHRWLMNIVGEWDCTTECIGPEGEKMRSTAREVVRPLGDLWIVGEMKGEMPGGVPMTALLTLGFDIVKKRFVGTWVGSPMAHMFVYDGARDASGNVLTLDCTGPSFTDAAKMVRYQDVFELRGRDERRLHSQVLGDDGKWTRFMEGAFRRVR
jgi:hypothetical protein